MFGDFFGLPVHPLVVHAAVMFIMLSALGTIILAVKPNWRHKYGWLLVSTSWGAVLAAWLSVDSGNILTQVPGLGSAAHAGGGTFLLFLLIPYAIIVTVMILLDRRWHWNVNKHGDVWRHSGAQRKILLGVCALAVVSALTVIGQTAIVGHSGAEASWGDYKDAVVQKK